MKRHNCIFTSALFVCITILPAATTAHADTVELLCTYVGFGADSSLNRYVSIDTNASTVASGYTTYNRSLDNAAPAIITENQVTWAEPVNPKIKSMLDRRTSVLSQIQEQGSWSSTKASRAF